MKFQIPKGLFDILPYGQDQDWKQTSHWHYLEKILHKLSLDYGYVELRTPVFEKEELFNRSVGENSDIVKKEMYNFTDKANRRLSLRPEGTAPIIRSFVEKNLDQLRSSHKFYYIEPMFRYDRPQAGRFRQHHQFGIEALGIDSYEIDVEVIDLLNELYKRLGLKNISLNINSVGDALTRKEYLTAFIKYLIPFAKDLSPDSQDRLTKNPLRILDSKNPQDQAIVKKAPSILDFLQSPSKKHFDSTLKLLDSIHLSYTINDRLVRGLDYYSDVVFEFVCGALGSQNSIGGGGRYNNLVENFGGAKISGVGFGTGMERILQTMQEQNSLFPQEIETFAYFLPLENRFTDTCFSYVTQVRHENIPADICLKTKKLSKAIQEAVKKQAAYLLILGEEEHNKQALQCKNLLTREQKLIPVSSLKEELKTLWHSYQQNKRKNHV